MLSDHEQRALEELERCFEREAGETAASRPRGRPPGRYVFAVLGTPVVVLLLLGAVVAALALATAAGIGWLSWRLWTQRTRCRAAGTSEEMRTGHGDRGSPGRAGESVRRYLRWLSEAE